MSRARRRPGLLGIVSAIAVAITAMVLTPPARAQQEPSAATPPAMAPALLPPPGPVGAAQPATPLALRPKPLELAHEAPESGLGWKVVAVMALLGGVVYYLRKRRSPIALDDGRLTIVRRTAIGMRSELLVVNVEGQRLLLGVTPTSIQSLAVLDGDEANASLSAEERALAGSSVGERFAAMLQATDARPQGARAEESPDDEAALSGQARGLLALRRRG